MAVQIMVIDDNPDVTQMLDVILRAKGYDVMTAVSGEEALLAMEKERPDLILCDVMMPGMDGFEVFRSVRGDRRLQSVPFVFVTALSDPQSRMSSTELGVEAYITKPFNRQELLSVVAGLLRRAHELQAYTESEMDSFKNQLLFMITHELNTPLSVIRMLTDSLRSGVGRLSDKQIADYLELLSCSTGELTAIVESMLLALQIDSGRARKAYETFAVPQILRPILDAVLAQAVEKAAERKVGVDCVGLDQAAWVNGHEQQLYQVFNRILDNAIRFSPKGGRALVRLEVAESEVRVSFSDRGPGMTLDEVESAFDRMRQINRVQQEQQGVGLSLSLVRSLVDIHGGQIQVKSAPGQGSTFTVCLPTVRPPV